MLQAMNTGHEGSMATIHANTPRDCDFASRADARHDRHADDGRLDPQPDFERHRAHRAADAPVGRQAQGHQRRRSHRHGRRCHPDAGNLRLPADRHGRRGQHHRAFRGDGASGRASWKSCLQWASSSRATTSIRPTSRVDDGARRRHHLYRLRLRGRGGHHARRGRLHAAFVRRRDAQGDQPPHAAEGAQRQPEGSSGAVAQGARARRAGRVFAARRAARIAHAVRHGDAADHLSDGYDADLAGDRRWRRGSMSTS